jgi:beta-lactam-binding protein with PASTA domain
MPAGLVFKQHPPAGDTATTWSPVDVWYSIGPHPRVDSLRVPPVLGLDLARATDSLRRVGFERGHVDTSIVLKAGSGWKTPFRAASASR